ncbi:MAG: hypothetical protein BGO98_31690 [Myxococcales bacterium 68-20]|nr:hypothetical protein [Myxococcales bacterium]OJY18318.1 MAG: hypothetical protein BGO98_31690 [Myxococcales bacterium 68-20]
MTSMLSPSLNPMCFFALRAIASLHAPEGQAEMRKYRTALRSTLEAAGIDMGHVLPQACASFAGTKQHALIVWYDVACDALRLFAPPVDLLDETTESALLLLDGTVATDLDALPIEDVDAVARMMALMGVGAEDAGELRAHFVAPHLHRYDEEFTPPSVAELEGLWKRIFPHYIGGTSAPPIALDVWIARAYAFGVAHVERPALVDVGPHATARGRAGGPQAGRSR